MSPLRVLPNVEALLVTFLRTDADVATIAAQRGYAVSLPANPTRPCYRVTRYGGAPVMSTPLELDRADMQVDAWGTTNAQAHSLAATIRAALTTRLPGKRATGKVTRVEFGQFSVAPDTTHDPAWPRYIADVSVWYRPL